MTSFLPEDLKIKVKERLRDVRFIAREMRSPPQPVAWSEAPEAGDIEPPASGLTRTISNLSDTALQTLEQMAIGILSSDPQAHFGEPRAYPLRRYSQAGRASGQALFARDAYFAAKQILRSKGVSNPRVSEMLLASAYRLAAIEWDHSRRAVDDDDDRSLAAISRDAAILAHSIFRARPVQSPLHLDAASANGAVSAGVYVACAIGLATAVAGYHRDLLAADDPVYASVRAAVDARYAMFEQALRASGQVEVLARAFADLTPHLP